MIYWFTGQPGSGKTTLAKKLQVWLQTDKSNWRKSVFHIHYDFVSLLLHNVYFQMKYDAAHILQTSFLYVFV